MKTVLRIAFIMAFVLSIGAAAFAQHYKQTNLVSNTSGVAEVTDPLRDCSMVQANPGLRPGLISARPYGTKCRVLTQTL